MRLLALGYSDYPSYLRSSHWVRMRAQYRDSEHPQECICGEMEGLQLHHLTYERVGAERLTDLSPLCAVCHAMIHVLEQRGEVGLDFRGFVNEQRALGYAKTVATRRGVIEDEIEDLNEPFSRILTAMDDLEAAIERYKLQPQSRRVSRTLWTLRARLTSARRDLVQRLDLAASANTSL